MAKSHKVLMLVENLSVPADPRVWHEACTLHQHGLQVCIISPKGETRDRESYVCIEDIHIYRYRLAPITGSTSDYIKEFSIAMVMTFLLSLKVLFHHGFDVIHAANPPDTFFVIGLFYRLLGKKYIFDQHDLAPEMFHVKFPNRLKLLYKLLLFFERCSYRTAHLVITTNISQKQNAFARGSCSADKVFIVRNGPDIGRFAPVPAEGSLKRGRRYLLAYIGVMASQDGVEYALHALADLVHKRGRQDVLLVIMGDGDQLPLLRTLTNTLQLDEYVHFTGWINRQEMLRYLTVTDVGLSPDPSNELNDRSTMLKTMEYMAMGKPVVAFDLPETRFSAQEAALYATPNRIEEFADNIEMLLDNEALRYRMGNFGRKRVEEVLCWEHTKQNLLLAYKSLFPLTFEAQSQVCEAPTLTLSQHV